MLEREILGWVGVLVSVKRWSFKQSILTFEHMASYMTVHDLLMFVRSFHLVKRHTSAKQCAKVMIY